MCRIQSALSVVVCVAIVALGSCVERKEKLNIGENGSVHYLVEFKSGSLESIYDGDAVPRAVGGWVADQQVERHDDGSETFRLVAERLFMPGEPLPSNYATKNDADAKLYLQFPTSLMIEQRPDGTYYHFARKYAARPWAHIESLEERLVKYPMREFTDVELRQWTPAQRLIAVRAFAEFETEKMLVFARAALIESLPELPQDLWLLVRRYVLDCVDHYDFQKLAEELAPRASDVEDELRQQAVLAELKEMSELTLDQLKQAMFTIANCTGSQYNRFLIAYQRQSKGHHITDALSSHRFSVEIEMPGHVIASNADSVNGRTATWTFDGAIMRDRDYELLVTSRVRR